LDCALISGVEARPKLLPQVWGQPPSAVRRAEGPTPLHVTGCQAQKQSSVARPDSRGCPHM